jgi:hypothetical protein
LERATLAAGSAAIATSVLAGANAAAVYDDPLQPDPKFLDRANLFFKERH